MKNRQRRPANSVPSSLVAEVASQSSRIVPPEFSSLVDELKNRFGQSLEIVLLYGSCLRSRNSADGVVDLYAVVDDYRHAYQRHGLRYLNAWLPPNVFYMEVNGEGLILRAKYAVISMADFERGVNNWFHSYLWARFSQPVRVLYAREEPVRERMHHLLAAAVLRLFREGIGALGPCVTDAEHIWTSLLSLTYAAELRHRSAITGSSRCVPHP